MGEDCTHEDAYIMRACCSPFQRLVECACQGIDQIVCPNDACTGVKDHEIDDLFERAKAEGKYE